MKLKSITATLNNLYPTKSAEKWDAVGILFGNKNKEITKVIVSLDLTSDVYEEALNVGAELIITHHPFIFNIDDNDLLEEEFKKFPYKKNLLARLKNTGIAVYAAHTNYDRAKNGMSHEFAKAIGIEFNKISGVDFGFSADVNMQYEAIENLLKTKLDLKIGFTNMKSKSGLIEKLAFLPGTGSEEEILSCKKGGADLIVTADIKWSTWVLAKELNINLAQVPHKMENVFVNNISKVLTKHHKELQIIKEDININLK